MRIINLLRSGMVSLYASIKRFPIAIGLSAAATILSMILAHNDLNFSSDIQEVIGRIIMVLALGIPISLCFKLIFERKADVRSGVKAILYLLGAICLVLYYFLLLKDFSMVAVTRYIGFSLSLYLVFIFIPYFYGRNGFELYVIKLLTRFFVAIVYSIVLFLGAAAILFTINTLLGIRVGDRIYFDVWLSVVGIFAPSFFLAGVPLYNEQLETDNYPKLLQVLLLYIVMPLAAVYTAILYIYFAKIIVTLQWPIGMVAHLVLWYSVICAAIIFLISPLQGESKWTRSFISLLPKLIIPLLIMMFVSVGIRVKAYGITENRYFVLLLGLWALGIMLNLNIFKTKRNIVMLISLALIAFLSVFGPWSSYSVSKFSQNHRLEGILQKYDMIKEGSIVKSSREVAEADKKEISEILRYFSDSHTLKDVKHLPKEFKLSQMENVFGFPISESSYRGQDTEYFSHSSSIVNSPIDIRGYSYMFPINTYGPAAKSSGSDIEMKYDNSIYEVKIYRSGKEIYRNSLKDFGKKVHEKFGVNDKDVLPYSEMFFTDENENVEVKFIFGNISGFETSNDIEIASMDFYVLLSLK